MTLDFDFKLNRTGDKKYDTAVEIRALIKQYLLHCNRRLITFKDVLAEDIADAIAFSNELNMLIQRYRIIEDPEELAADMGLSIACGPNTEFASEPDPHRSHTEELLPHLLLRRTYPAKKEER